MFKAESDSNTKQALVHYYRHVMLERTAMFALQARAFNLVTSGNDISDLEVLMGNSLSLGLHEELDRVIIASIRNITDAKDASAHYSLVVTFVSAYITIATIHKVFLPAGQHLVTLLLSRASKTYKSDSSSSSDNEGCDLDDSDTGLFSGSDDYASDKWSETDSDDESTSPSQAG